MHRTLQDFLETLGKHGELHRVRVEVSPILEISEIADRQSKSAATAVSASAKRFDPMHADRGGKAILFENVAGCDFPLCINVFGSYRRMELALGVEGGFEAIAQRIASLAKPQPPRSIGDMLRKAREFLPLLRIPPKLVRRGLCQEVVKLASRGEVDLTRLPLIKCWPFDGDPRKVGYDISPEQAGTASGEGRYITFAGMHTMHDDDRDDPRPASHNIGMYRAQLIDKTRLAMHWHMHHDGAAHWRSWKAAAPAPGKPMPIAICLGGESVLPYAATAPLPPGMSELLLAGFLNGRGIPMVKAKTVPLRVPANSEIVIEGWVSTECGGIGYDPRKDGELGPGAVFEGPFGDHTGFYSLPDRYPIVEVTAITHRRGAIFPAIIVGLPPQEDYYLGKATERIFLPLLRTLIHDIEDYHLPMFGCFHNCAFVKIRKAYPLQARRVMHSIWGAGQMAWTKYIIVVDDDVDVHDEEAVLRAMFEHCRFDRDLELVNGPLDILDHAASRLGAGTKLGFDATRKIDGEDVVSRNNLAAPADPAGSEAPLQHSPAFGGGRCALFGSSGQFEREVATIWSQPHAPDFVIAVDPSVDLHDWQSVMFRWCANTDPGRDMIRSRGRIAFDATHKKPRQGGDGVYPIRDFPPIIEMDAHTRALIDRRWTEYGFR